jgi:hypothetical protein
MVGTGGVGKRVGGALCAMDVCVVAVKGWISGENKMRIVSRVRGEYVMKFNVYNGL